MANLLEFEFSSSIGMCGNRGISFKLQDYIIVKDEMDGEEYWIDNPTGGGTGYSYNLWIHYDGVVARAVIGGGREEELGKLALKALNAAVAGEWLEAKRIVSSWDSRFSELFTTR